MYRSERGLRYSSVHGASKLKPSIDFPWGNKTLLTTKDLATKHT